MKKPKKKRRRVREEAPDRHGGARAALGLDEALVPTDAEASVSALDGGGALPPRSPRRGVSALPDAKKRKGPGPPWTHALRVTVLDPAGAHARPAALLAARLRASGASATLGMRRAGAKRATELGEAARLGVAPLIRAHVRSGEEVELVAAGPDAELALEVAGGVLGVDDPGAEAVAVEVTRLLGGVEEVTAFYAEAMRNSRVGLRRGEAPWRGRT